jgi:SAM-dependent methyltransferase
MAREGRRLDPLAEAFAGSADSYDRARPGYEDEPLDWAFRELGLDDGSVVLDLAAGTGKLSQALAPRAGRLIAVEPLPEMRRLLAERAPEATLLDGTAEQIPMGDGSLDAVFVGEAFHWFDGAVIELRRRAAGGRPRTARPRPVTDRARPRRRRTAGAAVLHGCVSDPQALGASRPARQDQRSPSANYWSQTPHRPPRGLWHAIGTSRLRAIPVVNPMLSRVADPGRLLESNTASAPGTGLRGIGDGAATAP